MTEQNANMRIWDYWKKTPEEFTKKVTEAAHKFTAINAYYQFQRATELFGPVGQGWGWDNLSWEIIFPETPRFTMLLVRLRVWVENPETPGIHLVNAQQMFFKQGEKLDDEVFKKLVTDTVTKGLSYLGCSADVFTGLYDDHRYISEMRRAAEQGSVPGAAGKQTPPPAGKQTPPPAPAGAGKPTPPPAGQPSERARLFAAIQAEANKMGLLSQDIKGHLKTNGYETLGACPIEFLVKLQKEMTTRAAAYETLIQAAAAISGGDREAGVERVATWLDNAKVNLLTCEPNVLLRRAQSARGN